MNSERYKTDKYIEEEYGDDDRKFFCLIYVNPLEIWVDFQGLPSGIFLEAMHDGTPALRADVGEGQKESRIFINLEWVLDKSSCDDHLKEVLRDRKKIISSKLLEYKNRIRSFE